MNRYWPIFLVAVLLAGCGGSGKKATHSNTSSSLGTTSSTSGANLGAAQTHTLRLTSPAFRNGGPIPKRYTCEGRNASLPLRWSGVPKGTRELLLVMRDPDAPTPNFVHWALAQIPANTTGVAGGSVPAGSVPGRNSFGTIGYRGPCPPRGSQAHYYVITLSALEGRSDTKVGFAPDQAVRSIELGVATLTGTFAR